MKPNYYTDTATLVQQYRDGSNLEDRIALHARYSRTTQDFHRWVFDHHARYPHARVLELGCGTGLLWTRNRERIPPGWQLVLTDFSRGMLDATRGHGIPAWFLQADAQAIPFGAGQFEAVIANHMLYHVPNLALALSEIRRVLKPGGALYAATNGDGHMRELDDLMQTVLGNSLLHVTNPFTLQNGGAQLASYFVNVRRHDFEPERNSLDVTEVEPLVAYIKSMRVAKAMLTPALEGRLRQTIAEHIAREGAFHITRSAGLFEATAT